MTREQLLNYYHTLRFMKMKQVAYRGYYTIRNRFRKKVGFSYPYSRVSKRNSLRLVPSIETFDSCRFENGTYRFTFLNLTHTFTNDNIDWNFVLYGKLWTYNLNYFDFLNQHACKVDLGISLIENFIGQIAKSKDGLEPFPIALRGINWIKFLTRHRIESRKIDDSLRAQYDILLDNLEYHLLGNHLLENGFSLLFGAYYFGDRKLFAKAREILRSELEEQVLSDGAHFELSPMYHQTMLFRILDCYNLMANNQIFSDEKLQRLLYEKASSMLGWLVEMTYSDGTIPHFNDSTDGIAPTTLQLLEYAKRIEVPVTTTPLGASGYRKVVTDNYELFVDVGNIGPDYIPGHAHSDTFNFELHVKGKPLIVDSGISTYENNSRRLLERSTRAHNTVVVNGLEQSEVWSSFRVARRARITMLHEEGDSLRATHDGYKRVGVLHTRQFNHALKKIEIIDRLETASEGVDHGIAYLHLAPGVSIERQTKNKIVIKEAIFTFEGLRKVEIVDIRIAKGYNRLEKSHAIKLYFEKELKTVIEVVV